MSERSSMTDRGAVIVECDSCGNDTFTVYRRDYADDGPAVLYIECEACGASVITATGRRHD